MICNICRWLGRVENLIYDLIYRCETKLHEAFIGSMLFLYGIILFLPKTNSVFDNFSNSIIVHYSFGLVAVLSGYLTLFGLLGNGNVIRKRARKVGALIAFLFFSCGMAASLMTRSTAFALMLTATITSAIVYMRLIPTSGD